MIYVSEDTRIRFRHHISTKDLGVIAVSSDSKPRVTRGVTYCFIETKTKDGDWETWQYGEAVCSLSEENFEKSIGRKIALTRALIDVTPKSLRTDFWEAYWRNVKR